MKKNMGEKIYEELKASNVEVILDDRINARFVRFKTGDFELLGFPYAIIIGKKVILDGIVEIVDRKTLLKTEVKIEEVVSKILNLIK